MKYKLVEEALLHFYTGVFGWTCVCILFLVIAKAFDTINHRVLLDRLNVGGVRMWIIGLQANCAVGCSMCEY